MSRFTSKLQKLCFSLKEQRSKSPSLRIPEINKFNPDFLSIAPPDEGLIHPQRPPGIRQKH